MWGDDADVNTILSVGKQSLAREAPRGGVLPVWFFSKGDVTVEKAERASGKMPSFKAKGRAGSLACGARLRLCARRRSRRDARREGCRELSSRGTRPGGCSEALPGVRC